MQKIPTLFVRDPETNLKYVTDEVNPACKWVLDGEGIATRKYDGTCVMFDGTTWWSRREVKKGKEPPPNFVEVQHDETTGKTVGWVPAVDSGFWKYLAEAVANYEARIGEAAAPRTYELCGPKINGNPEGFDGHDLVPHGGDAYLNDPRDFDSLRASLQAGDHEGIVWHHPDGRMAKLKKRDFPPRAVPPNGDRPQRLI